MERNDRNSKPWRIGVAGVTLAQGIIFRETDQLVEDFI